MTDSRGRTATKTTTFSVYAYSAPYFSSVESYRCTSIGARDDVSGTYARIKASHLRNEMAGISQSVRALIDRNARSGVEQGAYEREYQAMTERFGELEERLKDIEAECDRRRIQRSAMGNFLKALKSTQAPIADFTPQLWNALVEKAIVNADGSMVFTFRNGLTIGQKS